LKSANNSRSLLEPPLSRWAMISLAVKDLKRCISRLRFSDLTIRCRMQVVFEDDVTVDDQSGLACRVIYGRNSGRGRSVEILPVEL
jgi:hypothetical protein